LITFSLQAHELLNANSVDPWMFTKHPPLLLARSDDAPRLARALVPRQSIAGGALFHRYLLGSRNFRSAVRVATNLHDAASMGERPPVLPHGRIGQSHRA
jgi:hypothetical protein